MVRETLRIYPSSGTIFERYVPEGGVTLHDNHLPPGTIIGVNAWVSQQSIPRVSLLIKGKVMNRNREVFGDDVETFRPERWLDSSPDQLQAMQKCLGTVNDP